MSKRYFTILFFFLAFAAAQAQHTPRPNIEAPNGIEVNVGTGNLFLQRTDLVVPGRGIATDVTFSFNTSLDSLDFGFGKGWTFSYNMSYSTLANKVVMLRPDGRQDTFALSGSIYQPPVGVFDKLEEYSAGKFRLKTTHGMKYFFDDATHKKLTKIEDPNGNALTLTYSGSNLASLTNPSGRSLNFSFANNRLTQITDVSVAPNRTILYEYDAAGRLTCVADPLGNEDCYEYGDFHQITKVTDKRGSPVSIEYDGGRRVSRIVSCLGEQRIAYVNNLPSTGVFALGLLLPVPGSKTYLTEQNGGVTRNTRYSLDLQGRLIALQNPNGNDAFFTYDAGNNLTSFTDFNSKKYLYTYDSFGNVLTESDPAGKTTTYTYEPNFNKIASVKDRNGNTTSFTYSASGNLLSMSAPLGVSESYGYDAFGNLTSTTDGSGHVTTYSYGSQGNLQGVQFPIGSQTFNYDGAGNLTLITDANGNTVNFTYDALNRLLSIADPLGKTTTFTYDPEGNLASETDPEGNGKTYAYDAFGRLVSVTIPAGTTNYEYDFFGNLTKITDANGHSASYAYNAQNLVASMTDAAGYATTFTYDANANLLQKTQPNGKVITYAYDALNRLVSQAYPENADYFAYDNEGNLTSATNNDASLQFTYDALHRLASKTIVNWGKTVGHTYNLAGDRLTMTDPDGGVTAYAYDDNHRLTSLTNPLGQTTGFLYDAGGRLTRQDNANGTFSTYAYDAAGNLLQLSNLKSNGDTLSFFAYTYDDTGNRLTMTDLTGTHFYHYDDSYRVDSVAYSNGDTETFTYDGSGNRIGHTKNGAALPYSYNAADMILSGEGATFTFDDNGNMTSKTDTSGTTTYEYDAQNRLWRLTLPGGATNVFRYDAFGTRISLTDTAAAETRFVHDLDNILVELNGGNATQARYTAGLGVDSWIAMARGGGSYFYHKDGLGSVTELSNGGQGVVNSYGYEVFGKIKNQTSVMINPFTYTGREAENENGCYYYRTRFYNANFGLFISRDLLRANPIIPQSLNRYSLVHSNPVNFIDPEGEITWVANATGFVVGAVSGFVSSYYDGPERSLWKGVRGAAIGGAIGAINPGSALSAPALIAISAAKGGISNLLTQASHIWANGKVFGKIDMGALAGSVLSSGLYQKFFGNFRFHSNYLSLSQGVLGRFKTAYSIWGASFFLEGGLRGTVSLAGKASGRFGFNQLNQFGKNLPYWFLFGKEFRKYLLNNFAGLKEQIGSYSPVIFSIVPNPEFFFIIPINTSWDPNDLLGPPGYDTLRWVNARDRLGYTVRFENDPGFATAPAQRVAVTLPVDGQLNIQSFRLGDFGFGNYQFSVPPNTSFYTTRLDLTDSLGVFLDVTAGIDLAENEAFWIFQSIDPATGLPPADPQLGFLPVNDSIEIDSLVQMGEGFLDFSIEPAASAATGDTITAQADIVFDENTPIATNTWTNLVDAFPPASTVNILPPVSTASTFVVSWSGMDDPGGVGVSHYALYVQKDGGSFYLHQSDIDTTAVWFTGLPGSTYTFYTRATDLVGNTEAEKTQGDVEVTVGGDNCTANLVISGGVVGSGVYRSAGILTASSATVVTGSSVSFKSDTGVLLQQHFTVELGATFEGVIEVCPPNVNGNGPTGSKKLFKKRKKKK